MNSLEYQYDPLDMESGITGFKFQLYDLTIEWLWMNHLSSILFNLLI